MNFLKILIFILLSKTNIASGNLKAIDTIVALVNDCVILNSDVIDKINIIKHDISNSYKNSLSNTELNNKALNQLIINSLINQIAKKENIKIDHHEINQVINQIAHSRNMNQEQFIIYLKNIGLDYKKYQSEIRQEILNKKIYNHVVQQNVSISSDEIDNIADSLKFIDFNTQFKLTYINIEFFKKDTYSQTHILNNLSKALTQKQQSKKNIHDLICTYYKNNIFPKVIIQNTEWISWKNIPVIFDKYLQDSKPGDIIGPIYSYDGIHILKIKDICSKKNTFPIIKVKINNIFSKKKFNNITIKNQLLTIKKQLENRDTTFDLIIKEKSNDFFSKNYNNPTEWIDLDQLDPLLQKTLLSLNRNQISFPIYTNDRWGIIKLININKLSYSEIIHERAYLHLLHQKFNITLDKWIQKIKSESYIKIINNQND